MLTDEEIQKFYDEDRTAGFIAFARVIERAALLKAGVMKPTMCRWWLPHRWGQWMGCQVTPSYQTRRCLDCSRMQQRLVK